MRREYRLTESELTVLIQRIVEEVEIEEGLFGPSSSEIEGRKMELIRAIDDLLEEYNLTDDDLHNSIDSVLRKAKESNYDGDVELKQSRTGNIVLVFRETPSKFHQSGFYQNFVKPLVGGMSSGHSFGGGRRDV